MVEKKKMGLAAMSVERRREIARMGGLASPANFKYNKERAVAGGKKSKPNTKVVRKKQVLKNH